MSAVEQPHTRIQVTPLVDWQAAHAAQKFPASEQGAVAHNVSVPIALIREGSRVECADRSAGTVARILTHPQRGYATHIVVRCGRLRPRFLRVALNWVTSITPEYVTLSLSRAELMQQREYRTDHEIDEAVEHALHTAEALHDHADYLAVKCSVQGGIVTLHGNVRNSQRRIEVEQIARRLRGVIDVENYLFGDDEIEW